MAFSPWTHLLWLGLCLSPPGSAPSSSAPGEPLRVAITLELQGVGRALPATNLGRIRAQRVGEGEPREVVVPAAARSRIVLPSPGVWSLTLETPGFWTPPVEIKAEGSQPVVLVLNLWPTGTLAARLTPTAGPSPTAVWVEVQLPGPKTARIECALDPIKSLECAVPASQGDVGLRAAGFAPVYRRAQKLAPGGRLELGALRLFPGASIAGQVLLEDGRPPSGTPLARVRLSPFKSQRRAEPDAADRPLGVQDVGSDGFFQLTGLAAGPVVLEVVKADFAPVRMFPLTLHLGVESRLAEPLVLRKPLDLEFVINPATDWLGRPWKTRIDRAAAGSGAFENQSVYDGPTPEDGIVHVPGQTPGRFAVYLSDAAGNRFLSDSDVWVESAADATRHFDVSIIDLRGRLLLGGEPLSGRLWFGGRHGFQAVEFEADTEGRFFGALPRAGTWSLEVAAGEIETRLLTEVVVDGRGRGEVVVEIPDTLLFGRVLNATGQPVEGAQVSVSTDSGSVRRTTDAEGRFEIRGVAPGLRGVLAATRGREPQVSEQLAVTLLEGQAVGPVELVLRATESRAGRVVSRTGPVAGAALTLSSIGSFVTHTTRAQTDAEGRFEVRVDPQAARFSVVVSPPGGWLTADLLPNVGVPDGGASWVIPVASEGGTLEIESNTPRSAAGAGQPELIVFREGAPLGAQQLFEWLRGHGLPLGFTGERPLLRVPRLATGRYVACLAPGSLLANSRFEDGVPSGPQVTCAEGDLTAGGTLRLRLSAKR